MSATTSATGDCGAEDPSSDFISAETDRGSKGTLRSRSVTITAPASYSLVWRGSQENPAIFRDFGSRAG